MNVLCLSEMKRYSLLELKALFNESEDEIISIIEKLAHRNIIRKVNRTNVDDSNDINSIKNEENLEINNKSMYTFIFVGILYIKDIYLFIYPKYINNIEKDKLDGYPKLKQIIDVIQRNNYRKQYELNYSDSERNENLFTLIRELHIDYLEYGIYSNHFTYDELNGEGEILWDKTINKNNAIIINDYPIYIDIYTQNSRVNENDFIQLLHTTILSESSDVFTDLLNILDMDILKLSSQNIKDLGTKDYIINKINQEISVQFITRKQKLLKMMKEYVLEISEGSIGEDVLLVGTNNFEMVWEDVCSVVMNNSLDETMNTLGLQDKSFENILLKDIISKPYWKPSLEETGFYSSYTLQPDIVTIENQDMYIYDAKYYDLKLEKDRVKNHPGTPDITKQYIYEMAYREFINNNKLELKCNAFLFPYDGDEEITIGTVEVDFFNHILTGQELKDIELIFKPCNYMFEKYLSK